MAVYCISKIRDKKGIIKAYMLKNSIGETATIEHDELKRRMQAHRIVVENLQISTDNRIVDKAIEKEKVISKSKLQVTVEKMVCDIKSIIHVFNMFLCFFLSFFLLKFFILSMFFSNIC